MFTRRLRVSFFFVASGFLVLSAVHAGTVAKKATLDSVLARLKAANVKLKDMKCDVKYIRAIPLLEVNQTSKGTLRFIKPNHMHLKLGPPRNEEVVTDGKVWLIINHKDKQVEKYKVVDDQKAAQEAAFLRFGYGGNFKDLKKGYKIKLISEKKKKKITLWRLSFVPKPKQGPSRFSRIEITISSAIDLPVTIVLIEGEEEDGKIIHTFDLSKIKLNTGQSRKNFKMTVPRGYAVIQPQ